VAKSLARWFAVLVAVATLAPAASASAAGPAFLGVYGEDSPGTPARAAAVAAAQRNAGVTVVRVPFIWSRIEPFPGILDFSQEDIVVAAAAKSGLDVLPFVIDAPAFLSVSTPLGYVRLPANAADLGVFAARVVHRYGPGGSFWAEHPDLPAHPIRAWQVWNEPNLSHNWYPRPDATAYALLLKAAAAAIHAADPGAQVLAAGMPDSDNAVPFEEYVSGLYAAGAQESFDAFALNAYAPTAQGTIDLVRYVRGLLDAHGDTRPFDVTEFGWSSAGPDKPQRTSEDGQAQNIGAVIRTLGAERDQLRLERLIEFSWRDREVAAGMKDQWPYYTGLLHADASPKPALAAFRDAADAHPASAAMPDASTPASAVSSPKAHRRGVDHHPRVRVLGAGHRRAGGLIRPVWRVRVRCSARCMVRLRLVVAGRSTAGHVRVVLSRAGTRSLRVVARTRIRAHLAARRRPRFVLEVADIARTPLRVVAHIRLTAVGSGG
jgi:hypothetical protein